MFNFLRHRLQIENKLAHAEDGEREREWRDIIIKPEQKQRAEDVLLAEAQQRLAVEMHERDQHGARQGAQAASAVPTVESCSDRPSYCARYSVPSP